MDHEINFIKIFNFHQDFPNRIIARESSWIEFKESFNWASKSKYGKTISAFANNKGGYIVFGVKPNPKELVGLQSGNFEDIDESKITEYLNSVFSPEINFEKFTRKVLDKIIGLIFVYESLNKPVICTKTDDDIKEAEIYYRYNARSEKIKYPELRTMIDKAREQEKKEWMKHMERISRIGPTNTAILDISNGKIEGKGGTLLIDEKLISKMTFIKEGKFKKEGKPVLKLVGDVKPAIVTKGIVDVGHVRITDNPADPAIREETILEYYPLDYRKLTALLRERYSDFKIGRKYHGIRKELRGFVQYCKTRLLDPSNPKGSSKDFFSHDIVSVFDKYYTKRVS
ncbi:MAG: ATP-binding protein [Phycisphaerae bacterium]|nr:ATP-binding protein [Phycisphaerae bacterium]